MIQVSVFGDDKQTGFLKWIPRFSLEIQGELACRLANDGKGFIARLAENCGRGIRLGAVERKMAG